MSLVVFEKRQRKLTITIGISCIFTIVLYILPNCLKYICHYILKDSTIGQISTIYAAISCRLNPIASIIIFTNRQVDIRNSLKHVLPSFLHFIFRENSSTVYNNKNKSNNIPPIFIKI